MANNPWFNADGLYVKFGTGEASTTGSNGLGTAGTFGEGGNVGDLNVVEIRLIDLTKLTTTAQIIDDNFFLPKGCRIEQVEVIADTAATSGGSAVLTIGLMKSDRSTLVDATGVLSSAPLADHNAIGLKKIYTPGVTGVGSSVGTATAGAFPMTLTAKYTTAAYTAGALTIRIFYKQP